MKRSITDKQKLAWLQQNNIVSKDKKLSEAYIRRLYSFYQRNPLSTPKNLAGGMPKRIERTLEKEGTFQTPAGEITAKEYVHSIDIQTRKKISKQIPPFFIVKFNHRYKSGKIDDTLIYPFRDGKGITVTGLNVQNVLKQLETIDIPDMLEQLNVLLKNRKIFYKERLIGAIIHYETKDMPDEPRPRGVSFSKPKDFGPYLFDMLDTMLVDDIFRKESTRYGTVKLTYLEIFIRTRATPTTIEKLM